MSGELKPCPFCGGEAEQINAPWKGQSRIMCEDCGLSTNNGDDAGIVVFWNTRATPSQGLDAATVERAARAMCVADGLDPDEHIIGGQATGFEDFGPLWQAEERSEGQLGLTNYTRLARAALATDPHQHGAGNGEKHGG